MLINKKEQAILLLNRRGYSTFMSCSSCGYVWKCPNCGNTDKSKMNIARRTCGYIGLNDWNQGRTQEIKERYVHLGGEE